MNVADHTPSKISYENEGVTEGVLTPATGIIHAGTLPVGNAMMVTFERIANPDYAWRVTRDLEAHPVSTNTHYRREDRVLSWLAVPDGRYITFSCKGLISLFSPEWVQESSLQLGGGEPWPDYVDQSDLSLRIQTGDAGGGMMGIIGMAEPVLSSSNPQLGTLNIGGALVGWNLTAGPVEVYVGMLPRAAMAKLRPYLFSYFNR